MKNKSTLLFEYVISKKDKIDIEDLLNEFNLTKLKFIKLKFIIKSTYSYDDYINFLNKINGPLLLLLEDSIHISVPKKIIELDMSKDDAIEYFNMTKEEFNTMIQNLKRSDTELYQKLNEVLIRHKNSKKTIKVKKEKINFDDIAQFIVDKHCGYYQVCYEFKITDSYLNTLLTHNKNHHLIKKVKESLKDNKKYDKENYNKCKEVFNRKSSLMLLKKKILSGKSIADISIYFNVKYSSMYKFIKVGLKDIDPNVHFDINYFLDAYDKYGDLLNYCLENNVNFKLGCERLGINYKVFNKNSTYLKYTKQYKHIKHKFEVV